MTDLSSPKHSLVSVQSPGKLMLLGEHAVLSGYHCLSVAIDAYLKVDLQVNRKSQKDILITPQSKNHEFLQKTLSLFRRFYHVSDPLVVNTKSHLKYSGLGSSSALTVSLITALSSLYHLSLSKKDIFNLSLKVVLSQQEHASGFDIATSIYGNTLFFNGKSRQVEKVLKIELPLIVISTGKKADTRDMIEKVLQEKKKNPQKVDMIFRKIDSLVFDGLKTIQEKNWPQLGQIFIENQKLLNSLPILTPEIENYLKLLLDLGCLGAKISGAGGGDCLIGIIHPSQRKTIIQKLKRAKINVLNVKIGNIKGVKS